MVMAYGICRKMTGRDEEVKRQNPTVEFPPTLPIGPEELVVLVQYSDWQLEKQHP